MIIFTSVQISILFYMFLCIFDAIDTTFFSNTNICNITWKNCILQSLDCNMSKHSLFRPESVTVFAPPCIIQISTIV